ncbi:MAG TPA: glycosyltransferase family 2 protein [Microbacterium sp.]|uniref:glycosyltransferase family 2 protein n=1 Tax=Microbacterium sp. TaxID=51671 RepID=UPI002C0C567F|nr:glycosyltransferase family 2 protein [Microbacterium sp.]HWI32510.1 glycosyltransferase family 2 protein [Microbacterium sp.]
MTLARATVTVIVPGHDVAPYAQEAIDSLTAQTLTHWRAVLVDDASKDATGEIFAAACSADPRFRVVTQDRRRGLGAARNAGLDLVDTEFIGFLDADDVLEPGALERLVGVLRRSGSDFAAGAYVRLHPEGTGYTPGPVQPWVAAATDPERLGTTIDAHPEATSNIVAWSKVSRRAFWERTGLRFPEGMLYEDQVLAQRMYAAADAFDVVPDVVVQWRIRADGSSITQREAALAVLHDCLDAMAAGLAVLTDGGHSAAAAARRRAILSMDVPRLAGIATGHPDAAYRSALGAFTRDIWDGSGAERDGLPEASAAAVEDARGW